MKNDIKEDYISFEAAILLKEKGFEVPVDRYYLSNGDLKVNFEESWDEREYYFDADHFKDNRNKKGWLMTKTGGECFGCELDNIKYFIPYSAPTIALVIKWIRENFGIHISIDFDKDCQWMAATYSLNTLKAKILEPYSSPEEAENAAISYTLNNLI